MGWGEEDKIEGASDDSGAVEALLREHGAALARLVRGYAREEAAQQDLLQEIALALWRALPGFRGECSARTFVYRVAHNRCIDLTLRRARIVEAPLEEAAHAAAGDHEQALAHREQIERLLGHVRGLELPYRMAVMLSLEGLPHAEIAAVLGITEAAASVRLHRAREVLKARMRAKEEA
jgi:RNA polymerase sigma factor (sigma-70 family)